MYCFYTTSSIGDKNGHHSQHSLPLAASIVAVGGGFRRVYSSIQFLEKISAVDTRQVSALCIASTPTHLHMHQIWLGAPTVPGTSCSLSLDEVQSQRRAVRGELFVWIYTFTNPRTQDTTAYHIRPEDLARTVTPNGTRTPAITPHTFFGTCG